VSVYSVTSQFDSDHCRLGRGVLCVFFCSVLSPSPSANFSMSGKNFAVLGDFSLGGPRPKLGVGDRNMHDRIDAPRTNILT